jgi:hypothetical protein
MRKKHNSPSSRAHAALQPSVPSTRSDGCSPSTRRTNPLGRRRGTMTFICPAKDGPSRRVHVGQSACLTPVRSSRATSLAIGTEKT